MTLDAGDFVTTPDSHGDRLDGSPGDDAPLDARDRPSAHDGFGQLIADNVRRSGDLMLEMLAMRDSMAAATEREGARERERLGAGLADLEAGLVAVRSQIDALAGQVGNLRRSLPAIPVPNAEPPAQARAAPVRQDLPPVPSPAPPEPSPATDESPAEPDVAPDLAAEWPAPQVIDVIVHRVHRATIALSLQRYLGALDAVAGVEAREFAEGVLRMQVTARRPLAASDLDGWTDGGPYTVSETQPTLIEMTLADRA